MMMMLFCLRHCSSFSWHSDPYVLPSLPQTGSVPAISGQAKWSQLHRAVTGPQADPYEQVSLPHRTGSWSDSGFTVKFTEKNSDMTLL